MACRPTIHGNIEFAGTALAADPISVRVNHFKGALLLGEIRSLGHSANLGAEATGGLTSDRISGRSRLRISEVYPRSAMCAVLHTAPASVQPVSTGKLSQLTSYF
jgi:hypothetical protein